MASKISDWLEDRDAIVDAGYETDNRFSHTPVMTDHVHNPPHYTAGTIECIEAIRAALGKDRFIAFCRGNSFKYLWRMMDKHDDCRIDAQKAKRYLEWIIEELDAE